MLANWNEKEVQTAAKERADKGHKTLAVHCDVSDDGQVEAIVHQTVARFGQLDAAYNNAGIQNVLAETADSPRDDYDCVMSINLRGVWSCMKFELQQMRKARQRSDRKLFFARRPLSGETSAGSTMPRKTASSGLRRVRPSNTRRVAYASTMSAPA